ncbi:hypothetical protein SO802_010013, partial [Lithocarpus litseifolius]
KMGSCVTKIEEAKLNKPTRVEVLDEEEGEDWHERDKADYGRSKQFKKLMAEIISMSEDGENATSLSQGPRDG